MDFRPEEAEFSQALMRRANQTIMVADHSKFGRQAAVQVCDFAAVDLLVTETAPDQVFCRRLDDAGVRLLTADRSRPS